MIRADLRPGAVLTEANLNGPYLAGADLHKTKLFSADLTGAHLGEARRRASELVNPCLDAFSQDEAGS